MATRARLMFTPATRAKVLKNLRDGHTIAGACGLAGVARRTVSDWRQRGEKAQARRAKGEKLAALDAQYAAFADDVADALAYAQGATFNKFIEEANKGRHDGNWLPWLKLLERRWPQEFGRTTKLEHSGPDGTPVPMRLDISRLSDDELSKLDELIVKGKGEPDAGADRLAEPRRGGRGDQGRAGATPTRD
jgi:hypothetical protein